MNPALAHTNKVNNSAARFVSVVVVLLVVVVKGFTPQRVR